MTTTTTAPPAASVPTGTTAASSAASVSSVVAATGAHAPAGSDASGGAHATPHTLAGYLPLHRVEALTDGIFAVAMTLLVIELKLPADHSIHSAHELYQSLGALSIKAVAWLNSFFVLSLFWIGHHRAFSHLRLVNGRLVLLNLVELAFVSLMPFVSMMEGEYGTYLVSQIIYSATMAILSLIAMSVTRYIYHHPELCQQPVTRGLYLGVRFRLSGLIVISVVAVLIALFIPWPAAGNMAFVLMAFIGPMSRRVQERADARV